MVIYEFFTKIRYALCALGLVAVGECAVALPHDQDLRQVDSRSNSQILTDMSKPSGVLETDYQVSVAEALKPNATRSQVYRAILFMNAYEWVFGKTGIAGEEFREPAFKLNKAWATFKGSPSYEAEKATLFIQADSWLTPELWQRAQKLSSQEPDDIFVHLMVLWGTVGNSRRREDRERLLKEVPALQQNYPQLTGLWVISALIHIAQGNSNQARKKTEFIIARSELKIYLDRRRAPKANTEFWLKNLDEAISKLK